MQKSTPAKRYSPQPLGTPCWRSYIYYFICFSCMNLSVLWDCIVCVSSIIFSLLVVLLVSSAEQNYLEKQQHSNHTCVKRFNIKKNYSANESKIKIYLCIWKSEKNIKYFFESRNSSFKIPVSNTWRIVEKNIIQCDCVVELLLLKWIIIVSDYHMNWNIYSKKDCIRWVETCNIHYSYWKHIYINNKQFRIYSILEKFDGSCTYYNCRVLLGKYYVMGIRTEEGWNFGIKK